MISKLLWAALLLIVCRSGISAEFCSYSNTNQLVWDKEFPSRIYRFFGEQRESFFYDGALYEQVLAGLGGPSDAIIDIGEKLRFASACRAHSCDEKAAVVIACPDKILAVGILHFNPDTMAAILTIYPHTTRPTIRSAFDTWKMKIAKAYDIQIATDYR